MINKIKFENIIGLNFCGDIHGEFENLVYQITDRYKMENTVTICCGDIGMGFNKDEYYFQVFLKLNKKLIKDNNYVIFLRGNHDNADYFNNEGKTNLFRKYKQIHLIPDYTIIELNNIINVLCIGGATSVDRVDRIAAERRKWGKKIYWENEIVIYDEDKLKEINELYPCNIQIIATHTSPDFCYPTTKQGIMGFLLKDNQLNDDLNIERGLITNIFNYLVDNGQVSILEWWYAHFHEYKRENINGINFILLDCNQIMESPLFRSLNSKKDEY